MGHSSGGHSSRRRRSRSSKTSATSWDYGVVAIISAVFFAGFMAATIAIACLGMEDTLCNGIDSMNRGEQPICHPHKTQDVKVSKTYSDVTAYRYKIKQLPGTETRTTRWERQNHLYRHDSDSFRFILSTGSSVNITIQTINETHVDAYLMTHSQYEQFKLHRSRVSEWSTRNTSLVSTVFSAKEFGVHFVVVNAQYNRSQFVEEVIVTAPVYKVSNATAKETCTHDCKFKKVHKDEVVVLEYFGLFNSADVKVYSGKAFNADMISPLVSMALIAAVFCTGVIAFGSAALKKVRDKKRENAINDEETPKTTPGTTPTSDSATPLIPNAAKNGDNPPVYYRTHLPGYGI